MSGRIAALSCPPHESKHRNDGLRHATRIVAPVEGEVLARAHYGSGGQSHRSVSGTKKMAANGGTVRLSAGNGPFEARTFPALPTLLPP
jgi:predicted oxidoreductase